MRSASGSPPHQDTSRSAPARSASIRARPATPASPCAGWSYEADYLRRDAASVTQGNYDTARVRARINEGKFVIMSGSWGATQGHLSVVVGYTDDNRWYVHDTYGAGTDGSYDGAYAVYTWSYIAPVQMWAA